MKLENLKNRNICFLGLGLENLSLAKYLAKHKIISAVLDKRPVKQLGERCKEIRALGINVFGGKNYLERVKEFDIIFKTPGFIGDLKTKKGAIITTPMELFFDLCPAKIIAITGTKGKGTVASLCHHVLIHSNKKAWLAGNIGIAPFDFIDKLKSNHIVILELSSFQLIDFKKRPNIAVVTNLFSEHLAPADPINPVFHKNLKEYYGAKANIFLNQERTDWLVVNKNSHHNKSLLKKSKAKLIYFAADKNIPKSNNLIGEHNKENITAVCAVAKILKIDPGIIRRAVKKFKVLEHHLEFVSEINGVKFYNDSASTMPQATLAAVRAFQNPVVLILGGVNKGYDLEKFAQELKTYRNLKSIILIGKTAPELRRFFNKLNPSFKAVREVKNISGIIRKAMVLSRRGDTILFSPGFASFDMFQNSKDRGMKFKEAVSALNKNI